MNLYYLSILFFINKINQDISKIIQNNDLFQKILTNLNHLEISTLKVINKNIKNELKSQTFDILLKSKFKDFILNNTIISLSKNDPVIYLWNYTLNNYRKYLSDQHNNNDYVKFANFSQDGTKIISTSWGSNIIIYDIVNNSSIEIRKNHFICPGDIILAVLNENNKQLLSITNLNFICIYNTENSNNAILLSESVIKSCDLNINLLLQNHHNLCQQKVSKDNKLIFLLLRYDKILIIDSNNGSIIKGINLENQTNKFDINYNDNLILTQNFDKSLNIQLLSGGIHFKIPALTDDSIFAKFNPKADSIVLLSKNGLIYILDIDTINLTYTQKTIHAEQVKSKFEYSNDGKYIITFGSDDKVRIYDLETSCLIKTLSNNGTKIKSASFSSDGKQIISGGQDGHITVQDVSMGVIIQQFKGIGVKVTKVELNPGFTINSD